MRSVQDYINIYRGIANNLELTGDSVEALVQLLSQWSYFNEVEMVNYVQEASLETAQLTNSKIQHCVDRMYSVFRGSCPRVKLRFIPRKYLNFKRYDLVYSSSAVNLYYYGDPIVLSPSTKNDYVTITCILAKNIKQSSKVFADSNRYYIDILDTNLSNDGYVKINGDIIPMYRKFSDHIKYGGLFDLTLPDYGMRIYAPDIFRASTLTDSMNSDEVLPESNTTVETFMMEFCTLDEFNTGLDKMRIDGTEMPPKIDMLDSETYPGITLYKETPRDTVTSIHYKANRDRYTNSIMRSNTDVGAMVEEAFPDKVIKEGTVYEFTKSNDDPAKLNLDIYYIPYDEDKLISESETKEFVEDYSSYFVTENISLIKGNICTVMFDVDVELYQNMRIDDEVSKILMRYEDKFNIDIESALGEIETEISKIPNVRSILRIKNPDGSITPGVRVWEINEEGDRITYEPAKTKYCKVTYNVISTIYKRKL